jgi:predicted nuclease of restriction endonuclease-like (RecB) superfamily
VKYDILLDGIGYINGSTQAAIAKAVNQVLTVRNWLIGAYIVEYEQNGEDRAAYGEALLRGLTDDLAKRGYQGLSLSNLKNFRKFALTYPVLAKSQTLSVLFNPFIQQAVPPISQTLSAQLEDVAGEPSEANTKPFSPDLMHFPSLAARCEQVQVFLWQNDDYYLRLFRTIAWSNLMELCRIDDPTKRVFYELECVKSGWSIRELKRQISSMLYERVGLSKDKDAVLAMTHKGQLIDTPTAILRDPYVLEFLGLQERAVYSESDLEQALINHLQQFIHELGRDFCFVERQFRITIANRHYFLDLLFYHRRLRCLVAIDLKIGEFRPDYAGQMNLYLNYLKQEVALPDENPPVGIILCSDKDAEEVHFATAGMDNQLFVSRYLVALPSEETLKQWLREEQERLEGIR